jgi:gluconate 2-dehydrogenase gamma chain
MSKNDPIDLRQDRRQWLKTSATVLGASLLPLSAPTLADPSQGETPAPASQAKPAETKSVGRFFTPSQHTLVEELSETILPADSHSGGAKAAKVADYIDKTLRESTDDNKKALWRECLPLIDSMSQHYTGKSFVNANPEERIAVLTVLSDNDHITDVPEVRFFHELKRMTVEGYYTTKIGIHDELEYKGNRILQEFVGCDDQGPPTA